MKRRSNKITIYNNVLEHKTLQKIPASSVSTCNTISFCKERAVASFELGLFKTGAVLLLLAFLLQPLFAQAQVEVLTFDIETEILDLETPVIDVPDIADLNEVTESSIPIEEAEEAEEAEETEDGEAFDTLGEEIQLEYAPGVNTDLLEQSEELIFSPEVGLGSSATSSVPQVESDLATSTASSSYTDITEVEVDLLESPGSTTLDSELVTTEDVESGNSSNSDEGNVTGLEVSESKDVLASSTASIEEENDSESNSNNDSTVATSTIEQTSTSSQANLNVVSVVQSAAEFSFSKSECTLVEDGSYYCQKQKETQSQQDDLFAATDADGDLEIFLRRSGDEYQITNNLVDDASPYFDSRSDTVVWHRLINDRYQIVTLDLATGVEEVITQTRVNNMEPSRSGNWIVWQRWINDSWEIMLFDGNVEIQLTDTIEHDIAPNIRGDLVIWNVRASDGSHSLKTYDVASGVYNEISDPDGVAVANPRMVVMYDAIYSNGDTVMKGFDLVTGELIPLQKTPVEFPDKLPEPDSTGEIRALISPAPAKPEHDEVEFEPEPLVPGNDDSEVDLDLSTTSVSVASTTPVSLADSELDLRPSLDATTATQTVIEDLIIPPLSTTSSSTQS